MFKTYNFLNEGVNNNREGREKEMIRDGYYKQNAVVLSSGVEVVKYLENCEKYYEGGVDVVTLYLTKGICNEVLFLVSAYVERRKLELEA